MQTLCFVSALQLVHTQISSEVQYMDVFCIWLCCILLILCQIHWSIMLHFSNVDTLCALICGNVCCYMYNVICTCAKIIAVLLQWTAVKCVDMVPDVVAQQAQGSRNESRWVRALPKTWWWWWSSPWFWWRWSSLWEQGYFSHKNHWELKNWFSQHQ